jgi:hypothetical protein
MALALLLVAIVLFTLFMPGRPRRKRAPTPDEDVWFILSQL